MIAIAQKKNKSFVKAYIRPVKHCNFSCKHCFYAGSTKKNESLSITATLKFIKLLADEYQEIQIIFHGGEPTLAGEEYFKEVFALEKELETEKNVSFSNILQTNGFLLNDSFVDILVQGNCNVSLSFDGPHNSDLRPHTNVVYNIISLLKEKKIHFGVICVETQKSILNIINTYKWFVQEGINFKILPIQSRGYAKHSGFELSVYDYRLSIEKLYVYWLKDKSCKIHATTLQEFIYINENSEFKSKWIEKNRYALNSDGRIYLYGYPNEEAYPLCNIDDCKSILQVYESENYTLFTDLIQREVKQRCTTCSVKKVCGGNAIYSSFLYDSSPSSIDYCCSLTKGTLSSIIKINKRVTEDFKNGNTSEYNDYVVRNFKV